MVGLTNTQLANRHPGQPGHRPPSVKSAELVEPHVVAEQFGAQFVLPDGDRDAAEPGAQHQLAQSVDRRQAGAPRRRRSAPASAGRRIASGRFSGGVPRHAVEAAQRRAADVSTGRPRSS